MALSVHLYSVPDLSCTPIYIYYTKFSKVFALDCTQSLLLGEHFFMGEQLAY